MYFQKSFTIVQIPHHLFIYIRINDYFIKRKLNLDFRMTFTSTNPFRLILPLPTFNLLKRSYIPLKKLFKKINNKLKKGNSQKRGLNSTSKFLKAKA